MSVVDVLLYWVWCSEDAIDCGDGDAIQILVLRAGMSELYIHDMGEVLTALANTTIVLCLFESKQSRP